MPDARPFRAKVFLFRMLASIFVVEALFLAYAFYQCSQPTSDAPRLIERCPKLGEKSETLFVAAVSVTLSLLTGVPSDK